MAEEIGKLIVKIQADIKDLKKNLDNVEKEVKKTSDKSSESLKSFSRVAETALGFGLASLAQSAAQTLRNFALEGIKSALMLERGLNSLEFQTRGTADALINDLRRASNNTVDSLNLVQTANKALALGISKNELPQLMEVAAARAKVMGITTTQAFNDIATGIGRQSKLILDNLGIIVDLEKAYERYADTLGVSAGQLTDLQKKQALSQEILRNSAGLTKALNIAMEDQQTQIEKLTAFVKEMGITFGKDVNMAMKTATDAVKEFTTAAGDKVLLDSARESLVKYAAQTEDVSNKIVSLTENLQTLQRELNGVTNISIEGQAAFDVKEQEKRNKIDALSLDILREQQRNKEAGLDSSQRERNLIEQRTTLEDELRIMQLERQVAANNEVLLAQKKGKLDVESVLNQEKSLKNVKDIIAEKVDSIQKTKEEKELQVEVLKVLNERSQELTKQTREISLQESLLKKAVIFTSILEKGGVFGASFGQVSSRLRRFENLASTSSTPSVSSISNNSSSVINVTVENVYGLDEENVSNSLADMLRNQIR